jgi:hypothetical protein
MEASAELRETGVAVLRGAFTADALTRLRGAAERCLAAVGAEATVGERVGFNRAAHSVLLTGLLEFGVGNVEELLGPLDAPGLAGLFADGIGAAWACRLEQSWVRKKFAPGNAPRVGYHLQGWHQDGALGVRFPAEPGMVVPMTELVTCWIPLNDCGVDSPGLEFVRARQEGLLHFTELSDEGVRGRFAEEAFWAPALALGDGVVFTRDVLHRTWVGPEMGRDRLSVEYRVFPG